jgi:SAM-dependent methyltransferase
MDESYAKAYADLARHHWWWRVRDALVVEEVYRRVGEGDRPRLLDIGCGDGRLFDKFTGFGGLVGLEPDAAARGAGSPYGEILPVAFGEPMPPIGTFDVALLLDVLEHFDDVDDALRLVKSLLQPSGFLLITVPALPWLWTSHDDINHHRQRFTKSTLIAACESAGFRIRTVRFFFHALVLPKLLVRGWEAVRVPTNPLPGIPTPALNRALKWGFTAETRMLARVASWLPGSSLLVVAEPI